MPKLRALYNETTFYNTKVFFPTHTIVGVFKPDDITVTDTDTDNEELAGSTTQRGDIWPAMTPVWYDIVTGGWRIWRDGQAVEGLLVGATGHSQTNYQNGVTGKLQLDPVEDVQGVIMLRGDVHHLDVFLPPDPDNPATTTQANLDAALQTDLRTRGIDVYMLDGVR